MGSHRATVLGTEGYYFAVWAPNATAVSVIGNFNNWAPDTHPLFVRLDRSGIWEGFIPHFRTGEVYKYHIHGFGGGAFDKGDPYLLGRCARKPPPSPGSWTMAGRMRSG